MGVVLNLFVLLTLSIGFAQNSWAQAVCRPISEPVTYLKMKQAVADCSLRQMEDLLALLPTNYRNSFVLIPESKSRQESSFTHPRVVMFGPDASTLVAFNGDPSHRHFEALEILEFNYLKSEFGFHEIDFSNNEAHVTDNPQSCIHCHGANGSVRPLWDSYPNWVGVYGEHHDTIVNGSDEDKHFQSFIEQARNQGRYRLLEGPPNLKSQSFLSIFYNNPGINTYGVFTNPNGRLTVLLYRLNNLRIAKLLRESPDFEKFKWATFGALISCGGLEKFLPVQIRNSFKTRFKWYHGDTRKRVTKLYDEHGGKFGNPEVEYGTFESTVGLRYLFENRGISIATWTPDRNAEGYSFYNGLGLDNASDLKNILMAFKEDLKAAGVAYTLHTLKTQGIRNYCGIHNVDLENLLSIEVGSKRRACSQLQQMSLKALN